MSLDAQDWVWEHSQAKGTARLVLLAIADKASGADCSAYAGTTMLVQRSRASRRAVINAVDALLGSGELQIVEGRKGPNGETRYRLPLARQHRRGQSNGGADSAPVQKVHRCKSCTGGGADSAPGGCRKCTGRGADSAPHNPRNAENAEGTQEGGAGARKDTPQQPPAPNRPDGLAPIDVDGFALTDTMRRWALDTFGNALDVDYTTAQFIDHFRGNCARRPNWYAEWQKWVRREAKFASERATRPQLRAVSGDGFRTSRQQQETDDLFDRAMARAIARDAAQGGTP